nr:hypothetical protein [uncultured Campylobacter sp.]
MPQAEVAHISRKGKWPLIEAIYVLVPPQPRAAGVCFAIDIPNGARRIIAATDLTALKSTERRLPFTISFEPISCTLAPQPKHAENRSVKLLLSTA